LDRELAQQGATSTEPSPPIVSLSKFTEIKQLLLEPVRLRLLLMSLVLGLGGASVLPVLSLHLVTELGIEPLWVGVYFGCNTIAGVTISQLIARASDKGLQRTRILMGALMAALSGALVLAFVTQYWLLLLMGMVCFGLSSSAQPQLFALSREQVTGDQAPLFQSVMRAQISVSWIIGPPLAYVAFERWGFTSLMGATASLYGLAVLMLFGLKGGPITASVVSAARDRRIPWLVFATAALFAANSMYIIYMPLHMTQILGPETLVPGLLMGLVAGLEIPIMIGGGVLAKRWPLLRPLWMASLAGSLFFIGFALTTELTHLVALQLLNAVYIGLSAGLGLVVFQTLMPHKLGTASTIFSNAVSSGALAGASLGGVAAQWWGYSSVFWVCGGLCGIALVALWGANRLKDKAISGEG
jgi:SET family sugar efflux transporter-like MFS transporter